MWSLPLTHGHRAETIFASGTARDERAERERAARRKRRGRAECATFSLHTPQRCLVCQWLTKCTIYAHMHARERCLHDTDIYIYIHKVDRQIQRAILAWTDPFIRGEILLLPFLFRLFIYYPSFDDHDFSYRRWLFFFLGKIESFFLSFVLFPLFGIFAKLSMVIFSRCLGDLWRETKGREFGSYWKSY